MKVIVVFFLAGLLSVVASAQTRTGSARGFELGGGYSLIHNSFGTNHGFTVGAQEHLAK